MLIPITFLNFYFFLRLTLLFNNFGITCQILHNSFSPNHPDLEQWLLTRFLEEIITLMLQSLSQTGMKRKYNVLGKLSHVCFTGSFFLLSLSRSINSGHFWKGRCFPLAPQPWQCSRLLTHSLRQEAGDNSNSTLQLCHSCIKQIKKVEEAQEAVDNFLCTHGPLGPAWRTQGVKSPSALLTRPWVALEQARDLPPQWTVE